MSKNDFSDCKQNFCEVEIDKLDFHSIKGLCKATSANVGKCTFYSKNGWFNNKTCVFQKGVCFVECSCGLAVEEALSRNDYVKSLVALMESDNCEELQGVAENTTDTITQIVLSRNPYCNAATLEALSNAKSDTVRRAVANHEHTSPDTLVKLARDPAYWVRSTVAKNYRTPRLGMLILLRDIEEEIRSTAKEKMEDCPPDRVKRKSRKPPNYMRINRKLLRHSR